MFCALYRVGLLGYLHHDWVRGEWVQRFLRPGEGTLEPDGVLPQATHYLVHPVLSDVVGRLNPAYLQHIDRVNIVGYGRPWRGTPGGDSAVTARMLCVLTADVHGFGELMRARADAPGPAGAGGGGPEVGPRGSGRRGQRAATRCGSSTTTRSRSPRSPAS